MDEDLRAGTSADMAYLDRLEEIEVAEVERMGSLIGYALEIRGQSLEAFGRGLLAGSDKAKAEATERAAMVETLTGSKAVGNEAALERLQQLALDMAKAEDITLDEAVNRIARDLTSGPVL